MKDDLTDHDFEDISALIQKEEEDALAFFRMRNFRKRLETRIKKEAGGKRPPLFSQARRVFVMVTVLVLILAGAFFLFLQRPGAGPPPEFRALASALGRLPGLSHPRAREWTAQSAPAGTFQLADSVQQALVHAEQTKRQQESRVSVPAEAGKAPRLSLDQKMEILFQEKTIERAFFLIKQNSKEV